MINRLSQIYSMLSDKNRLRFLPLLDYKTMCVCELPHIFGICQPSVSRHLKKLKEAGQIESRQGVHLSVQMVFSHCLCSVVCLCPGLLV